MFLINWLFEGMHYLVSNSVVDYTDQEQSYAKALVPDILKTFKLI